MHVSPVRMSVRLDFCSTGCIIMHASHVRMSANAYLRHATAMDLGLSSIIVPRFIIEVCFRDEPY
jgi:hypothetical protein